MFVSCGRGDLFVQAKLWNSNHRPEHVKADLMATLKDLQLSYLDSFVIHWPQAVPSTGKNPTLRPNGCYPAHKNKSKTACMVKKLSNGDIRKLTKSV